MKEKLDVLFKLAAARFVADKINGLANRVRPNYSISNGNRIEYGDASGGYQPETRGYKAGNGLYGDFFCNGGYTQTGESASGCGNAWGVGTSAKNGYGASDL